MMEDLCFIVNPASRSGKSGRLIERLRGYLSKHASAARLLFTERPNHATDLARQAALAGQRRIIAVGGDGTFNEVANGILDLPAESRPAIGAIPNGTGGDFARRLRELHSFPKDFSWLRETRSILIDVGEVTMEDAKCRPSIRHFLNVADAGVSGEVVRQVNASPKRFGSFEYLIATLRSVRNYRPPRVEVLAPGQEKREIDLLLAVVANGRYFGGGMCIAPQAELDDGRLDFLVADRLPYLALLAQLPRLYRRLRFGHPQVHYSEGALLSLEAEKGEISLDLDGEFFRVRKAVFRILPRVLPVLVPSLSSSFGEERYSEELTPR